MATGQQLWLFFTLSIVFACVPGVVCDDYHIGGLVAAAAVSFILLAVVIAMVAAGLTWNNWYPQLQWAKGKVKMPKAYWKKREEAKLRLLHGSRSGLASLTAPSESGLPNGHNTSRVRDTGSFRASWVQGWNNANGLGEPGYEEMALAMDLGDEREEEIRIETTVVDNEALDLGPFRVAEPTSAASAAAAANASAATGDSTAANSSHTATMEMTEEEDPGDSYVYSVVDRSQKKPASPRSFDPEGEADETEAYGEGPSATSEKVTSFSKLEPYLVAL